MTTDDGRRTMGGQDAAADYRRSCRAVGVHEERGSLALIDIITHVVEHEEEHCMQLEAIRL
ncbi:MAG: hypothetical protein ACJ8CR_38935 [Roseiflexaceae bacterium]